MKINPHQKFEVVYVCVKVKIVIAMLFVLILLNPVEEVKFNNRNN